MKKTRTISLIMALALALTTFAVPYASSLAAKKAKLGTKKMTLTVGDKKKIKIKNKNKKAKYSYSSSKKAIAAVNKKGTVTAKKKGTAKITVKEKLGKTRKLGTVKVTVKEKSSGDGGLVPTPDNNANPGGQGNTPAQEPAPVPTEEPEPTPEPTETPVPFENLVEVNALGENRSLPDVFQYIDGTEVNADNWSGRAWEIRCMYQYYMYGIWRDGEGETCTYNASGDTLNINIETNGSVEGQMQGEASFNVQVNVPSGEAPENGWPVVVYMGDMSEKDYMLENGYAVIIYDTAQVSSDSSARTGAFYQLYPYNRSNWREQTGVLMAWAWGASKILDALYAGARDDYNINPDFAIVAGVSRWGKATAVTGAFETRFKIALPTCSGCGGMGVFRYNPDAAVTQTYDVSSLGYQNTFTYQRGDVETLGSIQSSGESYWFCDRFLQFRSIYQLPFDQHFLSTLYAAEGRTLMLIGGFNWDTWQNTPNLWYNFQEAKKVFDMLDLSNNIIINLHDTSMGHNVVHDDVVALVKYCDEMYNGVDVPDFDISDLHTTLFDLESTPAGINNKAVYEAQIPQ